MSDDHYRLDSVLFGGDDPPDDGSFDPFLPGLGSSDGTDDGPDGTASDSSESDDPDGIIRYGRFGGESGQGLQSDDDDSVPWPGGTDQPTTGYDEQLAAERSSAGNRYIRRVADSRTGSTRAGEDGSGAETVAGSISDAQQRLKVDERSRTNLPTAARNAIAVQARFERQGIKEPPTFQRAEFEASLRSLMMRGGSWVLQLDIQSSDVVQVKDAHGLALIVTIDRKKYGDG